MTREEVQVSYNELAAKTGDLFFVVENLKAQLEEKLKLLQQYKAERVKLQKTLEAIGVPSPETDCD